MATHLFSPFRSRSLTSLLRRLRPLATTPITTAQPTIIHPRAAAALSTQATSSSLNDPNPNWQNRPPKETILLDGCDFEHWLVVMEKPEGDPTRDEIIDKYIKTLSQVVGSEEEARMKIYSVSTRCYFAFGALVSEELSYKLKELPGVRWVLPDSYLDVKNKDYGGEPFINGQAVPYDPKYHEEWIRNNARANERNRRNDRPRNFDRSRNFERRDNMRNQGMQNAGPNMGGAPPNRGPPPPTNNWGAGPNNMGGGAPPSPAPNNLGGGAPPPPPNNWGAGPNMAGVAPPSPPQPNNWGGAPNNRGPPPPNNWGGAPNNMGPPPPPPNNWGGAPNNMGPPQANNWGGAPNNPGGGAPQPANNWGGAPNMGGGPPPQNSWGGAPPNQQGYAPNNNMGNMTSGDRHSA